MKARFVMDESFFEDFIASQEVGLKQDAKRAIDAFVRSFTSISQKRAWVQKNIETLSFGNRYRIRHELYIGVIFPVLYEGYMRQDAWGKMWLSKTIQNLYNAKVLWEKIEYKSDLLLAREAYELDRQSAEIRNCLLEVLMRGFEYCEHEWPSALLCGPNNTPLECDEVLEEIELARALDSEGQFAGYLWSFEKKVEVYKARLLSA